LPNLWGGAGTAAWDERAVHGAAELVPMLDALASSLEAAGYSHKEVFGVRLAVEEAVVNAIKHAHGGDPAKTVRVRYRVTPERFVAEVQDEGPGFDPARVPDPLAPENMDRDCGRGLLLIRNYMTSVQHNAAGNHVTLCKERHAS
jgi:serine/threonine-protein kinase RsbW